MGTQGSLLGVLLLCPNLENGNDSGYVLDCHKDKMRQSYPERQHNIERLGCSDCLGPYSATKWPYFFQQISLFVLQFSHLYNWDNSSFYSTDATI